MTEKRKSRKPIKKPARQSATALSSASAVPREEYFKFFQLSTDPMCIADPFGCFRQVNAAFTKLTGYGESELLAKPFLDFVHLEDRQGTADEMQLQVSIRPSLNFENRYVRKDGEVVLLSWTAYFDADDGVTYATARDITVRRRMETALFEKTTLLENVINSSTDYISVKDRDLRTVLCNTVLAAAFGKTPAELYGKTDRENGFGARFVLGSPEEGIRGFEQDDLAALAGDVVHSERDVANIGDDVRVFDSVKVPLRSPGGEIIGLIGISRDVTERKKAEAQRAALEAQLSESQKMEALGTLAGGVAHDFNNVLAMISGNAELARLDVGLGHPALESLDEISKACRRAKDFVQQILAFGRHHPPELKPISLTPVVEETARLLRATLPATVSLKLHCKGDVPAVLADPTQVTQALLNLFGNAVHSVQGQGPPGVIDVRLEAHTQAEMRGALRAGSYACLTVRDNGVGMDEPTRARIFEPFFTTKPRGQGTGLGLSVVHGIVQAHEASIEVESTSGEGSTFRILFPATEELVREDTGRAQDTMPTLGQGRHVLYVDDEEAIIFLMKRMLERQGFRVSGFTDPHEALEVARANPGQFDLAVSDYSMPSMSGLQVARTLKAIRADLPVVVVSGYITDELRAEAPAAGVQELVYKPDTVDELLEVVARCALAQSRNRDSS